MGKRAGCPRPAPLMAGTAESSRPCQAREGGSLGHPTVLPVTLAQPPAHCK